jgi:hypothetical protein
MKGKVGKAKTAATRCPCPLPMLTPLSSPSQLIRIYPRSFFTCSIASKVQLESPHGAGVSPLHLHPTIQPLRSSPATAIRIKSFTYQPSHTSKHSAKKWALQLCSIHRSLAKALLLHHIMSSSLLNVVETMFYEQIECVDRWIDARRRSGVSKIRTLCHDASVKRQ